MQNYTPTLSDHIIAFLGSARSSQTYYRILRQQTLRRVKPSSIYATFNRLQKKGYIKKSGQEWSLTRKKYVKRSQRTYIAYTPSPFKEKAPDYAILCFDIPETKRRERKWLRHQLQIFGYRMIQKSIWIGPGPLPKSFTTTTERLGINKNIRRFKIT